MGQKYGSNMAKLELVALIDAANPKSYPGSGTTWYDISGKGNHFTLYNSPTYASGAITFNGTNQYARSTNTIDLTPYSYITVESVIKADSTSASVIAYEHSANWNTNAGGFGLAIHSNGSTNYVDGFHTNYNSNGVARNYEATLGTSWASHVNIFGAIGDSTGRLTYVNGALSPFTTLNGYSTGTATTNSTTRNDYFYLASRGGTSSFANMKISLIRIYGAKLSSSDVVNNFNGVQGRVNA